MSLVFVWIHRWPTSYQRSFLSGCRKSILFQDKKIRLQTTVEQSHCCKGRLAVLIRLSLSFCELLILFFTFLLITGLGSDLGLFQTLRVEQITSALVFFFFAASLFFLRNKSKKSITFRTEWSHTLILTSPNMSTFNTFMAATIIFLFHITINFLWLK